MRLEQRCKKRDYWKWLQWSRWEAVVAGSGVVTVKGEKRSDFGCVSNPVWAELLMNYMWSMRGNSRMTPKGFGLSSWKHGIAVDWVGKSGEMASLD